MCVCLCVCVCVCACVCVCVCVCVCACACVEWSKEDLLTAWLDNAPKVCEEAGVDMPTQDADNTDFLASQSHVSLGVGVAVTPTSAEGGNDGSEDASECGICCVSCDSHVTVPCGHHFCRDCWKQ